MASVFVSVFDRCVLLNTFAQSACKNSYLPNVNKLKFHCVYAIMVFQKTRILHLNKMIILILYHVYGILNTDFWIDRMSR